MELFDLNYFKNKKIIYLSPHHDDMAFSSGGLGRLIAEECSAFTLVTIFTKSTWVANYDGILGMEEVSNLRAQENEAYCKELGISFLDLGFPDSSLRGYDDWTELCAKVENDEALYLVNEYIQRILKEYEYDYIFCPTGIGGHIDHQIINESIKAQGITNIFFYEDLPYATRILNTRAVDALSAIAQDKLYNIDISQVIDKKRKDMLIYKSQIEPDLVNQICQYGYSFYPPKYVERIYCFDTKKKAL